MAKEKEPNYDRREIQKRLGWAEQFIEHNAGIAELSQAFDIPISFLIRKAHEAFFEKMAGPF